MTAQRAAAEMEFELGQYVGKHPVGTVVAAFGVGYLLSGALFSRATARMLGLGMRYAAPTLVRAALGANAVFNPGNGNAHAWERKSP